MICECDKKECLTLEISMTLYNIGFSNEIQISDITASTMDNLKSIVL